MPRLCWFLLHTPVTMEALSQVASVYSGAIEKNEHTGSGKQTIFLFFYIFFGQMLSIKTTLEVTLLHAYHSLMMSCFPFMWDLIPCRLDWIIRVKLFLTDLV